jgi:hypothetical protein
MNLARLAIALLLMLLFTSQWMAAVELQHQAYRLCWRLTQRRLMKLMAAGSCLCTLLLRTAHR